MFFTKEEISIINIAIQTNKERQLRQYGIAELTTAIDIFKLIKEKTVNEMIIDCGLELTKEQIEFIKKQLDDNLWNIQEGEAYLSLKAKL